MKRMMKSAWTLLTLGLLLIAVDLGVRAAGVSPGEPGTARGAADFKELSERVRGLFKSAAQRRIEARQEAERIKKDLRYMSEELDREILGDEDDKSLQDYSDGGLARIEALRSRGLIDPALAPTLDQLEELYGDLPQKTYAKEYAGDLVKSVNEELRWIADEPLTVDEKIAMLKDHLALPASIPGEGDVEDLAWFPVNVPLEKFKKIGPIRVFLMKHRLKRPKSYAKTTPEALISGKHNVQVGVEIEAKVDSASLFIWDQDYCFNIGNLHLEITPEWRLLHKNFPMPKAGQKIRLKGWTYFDYFHGNELEFDPADPVVGVNRVTVWEVHPVQDIEILPN
ncbi:MAG: hypothetical protein HY077_15330 [Elusimicrobia bacterium]|nr:hypothetical protein [Elusimicrobiota bacterium]